MWRLGIAIWALTAPALADAFTFAIGNPVAAQDFQAKTAAFVLRTVNCPDPATAHIAGTAEGLVKGSRRSVDLKVVALTKPGVYAIYQNWPAEGDWVVNLRGTCATAIAGAVVPIGPRGFIRESARFFPRPATDPEINAALHALSQGQNR
jgi:hypothetical protein